MTHHRLLSIICALASGATLAACKETTSSANIRTPGIAMEVEVVAKSEDASTVTATLQVGGPNGTHVVLDAPDAIYAEADGDRKQMKAIEDGVYEAKFALGAEDAEFAVILDREEEDDATANVGLLPAPFEITSSYPDPISRADDDIEVTWEPSDKKGDMTLEIEDEVGGCIAFDEDANIGGDPGRYVVDSGTLESQDEKMPETCDATLTLRRSRKGENDPALDSDSSFVLMQVRSDTFASAP